jgi:type II secretory pathway pseudopilin PulG
MRLTKLNSAGDTIIEVMIVLAVLGLSIGIAYATANRSLLNARQAQESAEASSLAQGQVEQIRANSPDTSSPIYGGDPFCFDGNTFTNITTSPPDSCKGASGYNDRYDTKITRDAASPNYTYTVTVTWDDVLGEGTDSSTLIYRVHPQ